MDTESENRKEQQLAVKALINEKMAELDRCVLPCPPRTPSATDADPPPVAFPALLFRYTQQLNSLVKIEQDQNLMIERLSNNEA